MGANWLLDCKYWKLYSFLLPCYSFPVFLQSMCSTLCSQGFLLQSEIGHIYRLTVLHNDCSCKLEPYFINWAAENISPSLPYTFKGFWQQIKKSHPRYFLFPRDHTAPPNSVLLSFSQSVLHFCWAELIPRSSSSRMLHDNYRISCCFVCPELSAPGT